uniref:Contraction-inhibiting peptide 1 n=1 Tax=Mytilus edulis TaxID=6550 RepID=CIP1_MYTED|nr:RecName: Full=Contraction-inhibiting peptide 1; AltName: Full=MIP I [Mytilus edulis]
GSPMFV